MNFKELKIKAKEDIKGNILTYFGLSVVINVIYSLVTVIGTLVLCGPLGLGMALFILEIIRNKKGDFATGFKGFSLFLPSFVASLLQFIFIFLWSLLFIIPGIVAGYGYSMTYFILADNPSLSGSEAIKKSKEMMKGHKWELFCLHFSFFWWYVLAVITLGIACIYIAPYLDATVANYYEKLKSASSETECM